MNMKDISREERNKPILDYYFQVTGERETVPNAIMHHRIAQYGPPCENCGKPYRTPKASFCAACGHRRFANEQPEKINKDELGDIIIDKGKKSFWSGFLKKIGLK